MYKENHNYTFSAKPSKLVLLLTLILANDIIHNNPGPIRFPCGIGQKSVATNHRSIQCDECNFWVHKKMWRHHN